MDELFGLIGPLLIMTCPFWIPIGITLVIVGLVYFFKYLFKFTTDIFKKDA